MGITYIKNVAIRSAYIADTYAGKVYTGSTYTGSICAKGTCTGGAFDKVAYVGSVCTIEHLRMHSEFFWILKVKLFGIKLEIGVVAGWCSLHLL